MRPQRPGRLFGTAFLAVLALAVPATSLATQAIANWDVVPFQRLESPLKVGVVAFHETGVDVQFLINGTDAGLVTEPTWNDWTGVTEYWIEIDPANHPDGPLTLSATAIPEGEGHEARVLSNRTLYANAGGTLGSDTICWADALLGNDTTGNGSEAAPYQTIKKAVLQAGDGGTVYLKAGTGYKLTSIGGSTFTHWTTVSAAPGLTAEDVHILTYGKDSSSTGRYGKNRIRWHKVSLYCDRNAGWGSLFYSENGHHTWFDEVVLYDKNGRWANSTLFNGNGATYYLTNSRIRDVSNCGGGFQRNLYIANIGADIYRGSNGLTAINVTIRNMDKGTTSAHPDFIQFYNPSAPVENVILYNMKVYDMLAQGIFGADGVAEDVAFVNILLEKDPPSSALRSQLTGTWNHALLWNATLVDQLFDFRTSPNISNFDVRNCLFSTFTTDNVNHPSIAIRSAHTKSLSSGQSAPLGTNATLGNPAFQNEATDDYRITSNSPAYGTGILCPGVPADVDGFPYLAGSPDRGVFSRANAGPFQNIAPSARLTEVAPSTQGNAMRFQLSDAPARRFRIEASSDMVNWTLLGERFTDSEGVIHLVDKPAPSLDARFFRFERIDFPESFAEAE